MSEEQNPSFNEDMINLISELLNKANVTNSKTEEHANAHLEIDCVSIPMRVDDLPLLFIGSQLLPNILNYLVNILPQFIYPYIVAYLQDLSSMRDDPITINELYDYLRPEKE